MGAQQLFVSTTSAAARTFEQLATANLDLIDSAVPIAWIQNRVPKTAVLFSMSRRNVQSAKTRTT